MKNALKFKTNIKCLGCVSTVTPALDEAVGAGNWEVNIQSPDKELTITTENPDADTVIAAVVERGFKAELMEQAN